MATWDDVRRVALALPETAQEHMHGMTAWKVRGKLFAWERPLRRSDLRDLEALGEPAPDGEILGVRVEHEGVKLALIQEQPEIYFTIPHFNGYSAVLVRLGAIDQEELRELIVEAWLLRAPKKIAKAFLESAPQWPLTNQ